MPSLDDISMPGIMERYDALLRPVCVRASAMLHDLHEAPAAERVSLLINYATEDRPAYAMLAWHQPLLDALLGDGIKMTNTPAMNALQIILNEDETMRSRLCEQLTARSQELLDTKIKPATKIDSSGQTTVFGEDTFKLSEKHPWLLEKSYEIKDLTLFERLVLHTALASWAYMFDKELARTIIGHAHQVATSHDSYDICPGDHEDYTQVRLWLAELATIHRAWGTLITGSVTHYPLDQRLRYLSWTYTPKDVQIPGAGTSQRSVPSFVDWCDPQDLANLALLAPQDSKLGLIDLELSRMTAMLAATWCDELLDQPQGLDSRNVLHQIWNQSLRPAVQALVTTSCPEGRDDLPISLRIVRDERMQKLLARVRAKQGLEVEEHHDTRKHLREMRRQCFERLRGSSPGGVPGTSWAIQPGYGLPDLDRVVQPLGTDETHKYSTGTLLPNPRLINNLMSRQVEIGLPQTPEQLLGRLALAADYVHRLSDESEDPAAISHGLAQLWAEQDEGTAPAWRIAGLESGEGLDLRLGPLLVPQILIDGKERMIAQLPSIQNFMDPIKHVITVDLIAVESATDEQVLAILDDREIDREQVRMIPHYSFLPLPCLASLRSAAQYAHDLDQGIAVREINMIEMAQALQAPCEHPNAQLQEVVSKSLLWNAPVSPPATWEAEMVGLCCPDCGRANMEIFWRDQIAPELLPKPRRFHSRPSRTPRCELRIQAGASRPWLDEPHPRDGEFPLTHQSLIVPQSVADIDALQKQIARQAIQAPQIAEAELDLYEDFSL